jgi:hypothetical protein
MQSRSESLDEGLYRFRSHDHVQRVLSSRGWRIDVEHKLEDDEFCFAGPAAAEILEAWSTRLASMMPRFLARFGAEVTSFDSAFSQCLASEQHRSRSCVWFLLARSPDV